MPSVYHEWSDCDWIFAFFPSRSIGLHLIRDLKIKTIKSTATGQYES